MKKSPSPPQSNDDEKRPDDHPALAQDQQQEPKKGMGCRAAHKQTKHFKAWIFTFGILLSSFFVLCHLVCVSSDIDTYCRCDCGAYDEYEFVYEDGNAVCPAASSRSDGCGGSKTDCDFPCTFNQGAVITLPIVLYFLYLFEAFAVSSSFKFLCNIHEPSKIDEIHASPPHIWWKIQCSHLESSKDKDGNTQVKRVVTHTATTEYQFISWDDISEEALLNEWRLTKLKNESKWSFANDATREDYETKMEKFKADNKRDDDQIFTSGLKIEGFKEKMLIEAYPGAGGSYISATCYVIASLLLCTTCYRMYFASVSGRKKHEFHKEVSI